MVMSEETALRQDIRPLADRPRQPDAEEGADRDAVRPGHRLDAPADRADADPDVRAPAEEHLGRAPRGLLPAVQRGARAQVRRPDRHRRADRAPRVRGGQLLGRAARALRLDPDQRAFDDGGLLGRHGDAAPLPRHRQAHAAGQGLRLLPPPRGGAGGVAAAGLLRQLRRAGQPLDRGARRGGGALSRAHRAHRLRRGRPLPDRGPRPPRLLHVQPPRVRLDDAEGGVRPRPRRRRPDHRADQLLPRRRPRAPRRRTAGAATATCSTATGSTRSTRRRPTTWRRSGPERGAQGTGMGQATSTAASKKPFDGAVSRFVEKDAPKDVRKALEHADNKDILDPRYPYRERLDKDAYEEAYDACQLELVKLQSWYRATGQRIVIVFEGRDAAGKGGAIEAFTENLNPRYARTVALPAPSDVERGQWYFQRYIAHLPTKGEVVLFDRSWYNRAVVEHVFGWCTRRRARALLRPAPRVRGHAGARRHRALQVLAGDRPGRAAPPVPPARERPAEAVEAQPDRHRRPCALGRLHRGHRRDVRPQPCRGRALDGDLERGQAPGAARPDAVGARRASTIRARTSRPRTRRSAAARRSCSARLSRLASARRRLPSEGS